MKEYQTKEVRNVVLLGATKSGKTTLAEAMLFEGKVITRMGTVEDKNTLSDNNELEKINQRSIYATPLYAEFGGSKINFIDAPGSDDFIGGAYSAFRVCESGVLVINAQQGVEVGTESFVRRAEAQSLPMIIAVNQLDADKADWDNVQNSMKETFGGKMINVQFPAGAGASFEGVVDVLTMKYYKDGEGTDIPAEYADQAEEYREQLIEKAAEFDDALMEKYFEEGTLSEEEIHTGLNKGITSGELYPVFCVCGKKDIGVRRLLEFIKDVAPAPACKEDGPTSLFIYKNDVEQHLGEVSYFKVMSGVLTTGMDLEDPVSGGKDRFSPAPA